MNVVHHFSQICVPYKVYKCAAWRRHVIVSAIINYGDHVEDNPRMKISLGEVMPSKLIDIQYTASTIPNNEYTSMAFATPYLSKGPTYAFDDVSAFDQPVLGKMGYFQCSTPDFILIKCSSLLYSSLCAL